MPEKTDNYIRIPSGKSKKKNSEVRTITINNERGIKALYDVKNKVIVTYLFDINKWSMKEAHDWVKKNKSDASFDIIARTDYLTELLKARTIESKNKIIANVLSEL